VTPQSLLEVRIGLDMTINLKRHLDSSVQTAVQTQLSRYYGQDTQRITTCWVDRKALQDIKNCPIRFYVAIDLALNMKWVVKLGDKYYPNPTNLNFRLPFDNSSKRYNAITKTEFYSNNKDLIQVSSHEWLHFCLMVDWVFSNLDPCFKEAVICPVVYVNI